MEVDPRGGRTTVGRALLLGTALAVTGVLALASSADARPQAERRLSTPGATFRIPKSSPPGTVWTLTLWSKGRRLATATGTSGVLRVTATPAAHCTVQADVRRAARWYSGKRFRLTADRDSSCGSGNGGGGGGTSGGGTTGGSGSGGGTPPPTTDPPPTGSDGGARPGITPEPASLDAAATPGPVSALAFTGVGSPLRTLAILGLALVLLGSLLLARRRPTRPPTLEALLGVSGRCGRPESSRAFPSRSPRRPGRSRPGCS